MTTQMYPTGSTQVNGSASAHPQLFLPIYEQWNNYGNCVSPNEATQTSPNHMMMNSYSPSGSNSSSLSPYTTMQTSSSFPHLSPTNSDPSLSPLYGTSRLSTPTTPASSQSFMSSPTFMPSPALMPSPTPSQEEHLLQQDSQVDVCHVLSLLFVFTEFTSIVKSAWLHSSTTTPNFPRCSFTSVGWCRTLYSPIHVQASHYKRPQALCGGRPARTSHLLLCGTFRPVWNFTL